MKWDAENQRKLFAAIMMTANPKFKNADVAALIGNGCTAKAVEGQITSIRNFGKKMVDGTLGTAPDTTPNSTPATTPIRKRKAASIERHDSGGDADLDEAPKMKGKANASDKKLPAGKGTKKVKKSESPPATASKVDQAAEK